MTHIGSIMVFINFFIAGFVFRQPYEGGSNMSMEISFPDCQKPQFSPELAKTRVAQAQQLLGPRVVQRLLAFALYLLGAKRSAIGQSLNIPAETVKSMIKTINRDGIAGLEDRRCATAKNLQSQKPAPVSCREEDSSLVINLGIPGRELKIPRNDPLLLKAVIVSMANNRLLSKQKAAQVLNITSSYMSTLARKLHEEGAVSLADKRQGQKHDYRVPAPVKGEIIQQFAADIVCHGQTSSDKISTELKQRCGLELSPRTIRHHLALLGLKPVKRSLPQLIKAVKKTSTTLSS